MDLNDKVENLVRTRYPGLEFESEDTETIIQGAFEFTARFDDEEKQYTINPLIDDARTIHDSYNLRIVLSAESNFPDVFETDGRIPSQADFHKNSRDGSLCLVGPLDRSKEFTLDEFLDGPVMQFLYDQSYFQKYREWPRGEYSHGTLGLIENYDDNIDHIADIDYKCLQILSNSPDRELYRDALVRQSQIRSDNQCICGSGKRYRDCKHIKVFNGLRKLQKTVHEIQLQERSQRRRGQKIEDGPITSFLSH